jgi:Fe-S cluster biogenesis protein NfuA
LLAKQAAADAAARTKLEQVFETQVNPAVASHGGMVELVDYKNGVVYVRMAGGCQGCASSQATLKMGIERLVREAVPEVVDIVDVTNHSAGANPYYR